MKKYFKYDGKFYSFMNKFGNLMILNFLFILTSLPLITLVSSLSALYYSTVKTVRTENGYPAREYIKAFKREIKKGLIMGTLLVLAAVILYIDLVYVAQSPSLFSAISYAVFILLSLICFGLFIYYPIVLSRFKLDAFALFKLSLFMLFKHLPSTILLFLIYGASGLLVLLIPIPLVFIIPSFMLFLTSFIVEKLLKNYIKIDEDEEYKWYFEL